MYYFWVESGSNSGSYHKGQNVLTDACIGNLMALKEVVGEGFKQSEKCCLKLETHVKQW